MTPPPQGPAAGRLLAVSVGRPRDYQWLGRPMRTAIAKEPVAGPVAVHGEGLDGDAQGDREQHGGPDKAVYAYAAEDLAWWAGELGRDLLPASFGENLTTEGVDVTGAVVGEVWRVGTTLLQVTEPRTPCWKLGMRMGDKRFPRRFAAARRPGAMLRVLQTGVLRAGDAVEVVDRPAHGVTTRQVFAAYVGDPTADLRRAMSPPELAGHWRAWAAHRTVWHIDEERKRGELP